MRRQTAAPQRGAGPDRGGLHRAEVAPCPAQTGEHSAEYRLREPVVFSVRNDLVQQTVANCSPSPHWFSPSKAWPLRQQLRGVVVLPVGTGDANQDAVAPEG